MITAKLNNYRQSPRKVRLVADLVRGKKVDRALTTLAFLSKRASDPLKGAIESAVANALNNFQANKEKLFIKEIRVDEGITMKRRMPRARGTAYPIKKRTSSITVVLGESNNVPSLLPESKIAKKEISSDDHDHDHDHDHEHGDLHSDNEDK